MKTLILTFLFTIAAYAGNTSKTFEIKKGKHSASGINFSLFTGDSLNFITKFDSSAIYSIGSDQSDINKLFGFADCFSQHHSNSARFGWRWFRDNLEILAYTYVDGKRDHKLIKSIDINKHHQYSIKIDKDQYVFTVDSEIVYMNRGCSEGVSGYKLYPYFGGNIKAPHDINIFIDQQK